MITLKMNLIPFGRRLYGETPLIQASIWTAPTLEGDRHEFTIYAGDPEDGRTMLASGSVPKTKSGHRNPLHLLKDILDTIDLDALDQDYVTTAWDKPKETAA